jgi:hypothetical protein
MTNYEIGKQFFEYTNRGWVGYNPLKWENLPDSTKKLWIERALKQLKGKTG